MAVLCEAYSVIVRRDAIDKHYEGGWDEFLKQIPNSTMCTDEELVRIGFLDPKHANHYLEILTNNGLRFDSGRDDLTLVDQDKGPGNECKWIQFSKIRIKGTEYDTSICWLWEGHKPAEGVILKDKSMGVATPKDWTPEKAMTLKHGVGTNQLEFLRTEDGLDVYWDAEKKEEVFTTKKNDVDDDQSEVKKESPREGILSGIIRSLLDIINRK